MDNAVKLSAGLETEQGIAAVCKVLTNAGRKIPLSSFLDPFFSPVDRWLKGRLEIYPGTTPNACSLSPSLSRFGTCGTKKGKEERVEIERVKIASQKRGKSHSFCRNLWFSSLFHSLLSVDFFVFFFDVRGGSISFFFLLIFFSIDVIWREECFFCYRNERNRKLIGVADVFCEVGLIQIFFCFSLLALIRTVS